MKIEFDTVKLAQHLRQKRMVEENLTKAKAAEQIGITDEKYSTIERSYYYRLDIAEFAKVVTWLKTNPSDYFKTTQND